jgi:hypothetical protein
MAISSAICNTFKGELLEGKHNFSSGSGHTFKIALFTSSASLGASTTDAVCILAFGGDFTASNGTFTIQFPTADTSSAIIRIA